MFLYGNIQQTRFKKTIMEKKNKVFGYKCGEYNSSDLMKGIIANSLDKIPK